MRGCNCCRSGDRVLRRDGVARDRAPPLHDTFSVPISFVDTEMCAFPVAVDTVFTNAATEFSDANGVPIALQLHQSLVGTWSAKGITLKINTRELIIVDFENGIPVIAKHVGLLNSIVAGRRGPVSAYRPGGSSKSSSIPQAGSSSTAPDRVPWCPRGLRRDRSVRRLRVGTSEGASAPPPDPATSPAPRSSLGGASATRSRSTRVLLRRDRGRRHADSQAAESRTERESGRPGR